MDFIFRAITAYVSDKWNQNKHAHYLHFVIYHSANKINIDTHVVSVYAKIKMEQINNRKMSLSPR